jgi:hypothetical protein
MALTGFIYLVYSYLLNFLISLACSSFLFTFYIGLLFISGLFNGGVSNSDYIAYDNRILTNTDLETLWKETVVAYVGLYSFCSR